MFLFLKTEEMWIMEGFQEENKNIYLYQGKSEITSNAVLVKQYFSLPKNTLSS